MTLMRFDPFRELDGWTEQTLAGTRSLRAKVALDMPGVAQDELSLSDHSSTQTVEH